MQDRRRQKAPRPEPIYKPFLKGTWRSKQCAARALRVFAYLVGFIFVYLFVGQVLMFDNAFLRVLLNLVLLVGFASLLYNDGAKAGVDDVTYGEIALQRKESNRELEKGAEGKSYHPLKGVCVALLGVAPFFLVALVFAFMAQPQVYSLGVLPNWVSGMERRSDVGLALSYYHQTPSFELEHLLRVIVRLSLFPYVNMVGADNAAALLWLERLSPLLVLIVPMAYALGYLQGRRLRAGVHGAIRTNAKRRVRRERSEKRRRQEQENRLI